MIESKQVLMKVQTGPVHEFIAQARSSRDMWAGSYLLSRLTARAMEVFDKAGCKFVFPTLAGQPLYEMVTGKKVEYESGLIPTLPNVFVVLVSGEKVRALANEAKAAVCVEFSRIGDACWLWMKEQGAQQEWKKRWDAQLDAFPVFTWHAVEEGSDWSQTVELLGKELSARRNTRDFTQWGVSFDMEGRARFDKLLAGSSKDVLSGKEEIIGDEAFWEKIQFHEFIKNAGPFGAVNLVKRLFPHCCFPSSKAYWEQLSMADTRDMAEKNNPDKGFNPYFAVIAMDGDRMGGALQCLTTMQQHTDFSRTLASFAEKKVKRLVKEFKGQLIYAGGDDVLAMCPADSALDLADALRKSFNEVMEDYRELNPGKPLDASCGIAVGHCKFPLQRIVTEARKAEHRAKNKRGRAAFEMTLLKRSGEIIYWGGKWESKALPVYRDFTKKTEAEVFSGRFPYALAEMLHPYRLNESTETDLKPIIRTEFLHILDRQSAGKLKEWPEAVEYLENLSNGQLEDFQNLFLSSAFMNRQRGER